MSHCDVCEYYDECEYAGIICFCDSCRNRQDCNLRYVSCKAGHDIECNNSYEEDGYCDDDEEGGAGE